MKIKSLIPENELKSSILSPNADIDNCTANYKRANEKSLLFLLPGVNFDTYRLAGEYVKRKVAAIVTEDKSRFPKTKIPIIEVKNARRAFAQASSAIAQIDCSRLKIIGITGTNGKTSVATMLKHILSENGRKCGFIGTGKIEFDNKILTDINYSMTSPDPDVLYPVIKKMQELGAEFIVMEVSSHALELHKVSAIPFEIGIFTGLSHEHLDFHKNMENYFSAKEKLINLSKKAIINFDDAYGRRLYDIHRKKALGVGILWGSDFSVREIENLGFDGIRYILRTKRFHTRITLKTPGLYNITNSLLAFAAANECGIAPKDIKDTLIRLNYIEGRFECIHSDITVIIDYAHTPIALENLLKNANCCKNARQKITLVFGCGGERDKEKRPMMAEIAEKFADKTIVTTDNPRGEEPEKIITDIVAGFGKGSYGVITDRKAAITYAIKKAMPDEIIIIAGKGHEKYICDKDGYHPFDEKGIIREALNLRSHGGINES